MNTEQSLALEQALQWINEHYQVIGIVVSGSIIRGNPHPGSDFDIYVIHGNTFRQRVQRLFNGVPCELFINTLAQTYLYFESELKNNRPVSAHIISTGQVVQGHDNSEVLALLQAAHQYAAMSPPLTEEQVTFRVYGLATLLEDAVDSIGTDPATAGYIVDKVAIETIELLFLLRQQPLPRIKERLQNILTLDPAVGQLLLLYYRATTVDEKVRLATKLLALTTGRTAFFEWSSAPTPDAGLTQRRNV